MGFGWRGTGASFFHWLDISLIDEREILALNYFHFKKKYPLDIIALSNPVF